MARINLLPWRAERRAARQKEFMAMLGASALGAALLAFLIVGYHKAQIEGQNERNTYLRDQITQVDAKIKEIEELDKKKAKLLARKEVIEARNQLDTLVYGICKLVSENGAKIGEADKLMVEEELKSAEEVLERNKDTLSPDELRSSFEKLQAAAHKLAEAMYKQAGGGDAPSDQGGQSEPPKDDVIDAEFEDKK